MKRYCLVGVKGCGKSSTAKAIEDSMNTVTFIEGGKILKRLVSANFDQFDDFDHDEKMRIRRLAIKEFGKIQSNEQKDVLVIGHTTLYNRTLNTIDRVFTDADCAFYTDLILLESSPQNIYQWRKADADRDRICDIEIIRSELEAERKETHRLGMKYSMTIHHLLNDSIESTAKNLRAILEGERE